MSKVRLYRRRTEVVERLTELVGAGLTDEEIARELGYTTNTVVEYRYRYGLTRQNTIDRAQHAEMERLYREGMNCAEIARRFGCHRNTVVYWVRKEDMDNADNVRNKK